MFLSKDRDFVLQFGILVCKRFERFFQGEDRRLQLEDTFVRGGSSPGPRLWRRSTRTSAEKRPIQT